MGVPVNKAELSDHGEIMLAEQFHAPRLGSQQALRRLMIALLEDAVHTFQRHLLAESEHDRRLFREVETWLMDDGRDAALHFEDVCDALDLDADFLRSALRRWQANELASAAEHAPRRGGPSGRVMRLETARRERALAAPRPASRRWR